MFVQKVNITLYINNKKRNKILEYFRRGSLCDPGGLSSWVFVRKLTLREFL